MIHLSNQDTIRSNQNRSKEKIVDSFISKSEENVKTFSGAEDLLKSFPQSDFEFYSPSAVESFKDDFMKSEPNATEENLNSLTKDLERILVKGENGDLIELYVRKKDTVEGEKE